MPAARSRPLLSWLARPAEYRLRAHAHNWYCACTHTLWRYVMDRLLHISSSPRGAASQSRRIGAVFTETFQQTHPNAAVQHWDLWDGPLRDCGVGAEAKRPGVPGEARRGAQAPG